MTPPPSIEIPARENLLQKHKERVDKLPQPDRLIKICTDAGFLKTVEVGQYFMTKHTDEFLQFAALVTLPRDEKSTDPKGWIRGNTKIGHVLEVTTTYLQGKYRVEIRIESVNKHNSHSWVRISHGLNKLVTDLIDKGYDDNEQETPTTKTEVFAFASRSKAKAKPRRPSTTCSFSRTFPILERKWIDIEPRAQFDQASGKKAKTLLFGTENYLEKKMERSNSGDCKMILGTNLSPLNIVRMMYGRARWQEAEATRKAFNAVLTRQDKKLFISELFKVIQDAITLILHCRTMC